MAQAEQLALLKTDLGMYGNIPTDIETFLTTLLTAAADLIAREGVKLNEKKIEDDSLVASCAAWMYRKRASASAEPMPRMLRYALNVRLVGGAMGRDEGAGADKEDEGG